MGANTDGGSLLLIAEPKNWFSSDFWLREPTGSTVGEVRLSMWRERGSVVVGDVTYPIRRNGFLGPFTMKALMAPRVAFAKRLRRPRRSPRHRAIHWCAIASSRRLG